MSLSNLTTETKDLVAEVVAELLHDWIKYMEMRLLSVDWTQPSSDMSRHLHRGIQETRHSATTVEGVLILWGRGRSQLEKLCTHPAVSRLVDTLDNQSRAVCDLLNWSPERLVAQSGDVEARIRAPGKTLRAARDSLEFDS